MSILFRLLAGLLILIVVLALALYFSQARLAKFTLEKGLYKLTGVAVEAKRVEADLLSGRILLSEVRLGSPPGFSGEPMAYLPEILIDFDLQGWVFEKKVHFKRIVLDIEKIRVEKSKSGKVNLKALAPIKAKKKRKKAMIQETKPFRIDELELGIRHIHYQDTSQLLVRNLHFNLGIEKEIYRNITTPQTIVQIVILKILYNTTLGNLGMDAGRLAEDVQKTLGTGVGLLRGTVRELRGTVEDAAGGIVKQTGEAGGRAKKIAEGFLTQIKKTLETAPLTSRKDET